MIVPSENTLLVRIDGNQSHEELLKYIQEKQEEAPIRRLHCSFYVRDEEFDHQHPLFSFIRSTPTLEHVEFGRGGSRRASIDAFLDAVCQNHSIHTVALFQIDFSAYAIQKLMERKIKWTLQRCRFMEHPSSRNESTSCNIEELVIHDNDPSVMEFIARIPSWPSLRQLSISIPLDLQVVPFIEHFIPAAPILQELTLHCINFEDPDMLQSCATIVFNADLKWHLDHCDFHQNTMAVLGNLVKSEKAKLMRIKLHGSRFKYELLRTITSASSCVGNVDISVHRGATMLDVLPLLQEQPVPGATYPCTLIHLTIDKDSLERHREFIESIQHWTPCVKKLFLNFACYNSSSRPFFPFLRTELIQAVRNNLHLRQVELDVRNAKPDDGEEDIAKNVLEQCRAWLERYCERNRKLQAALVEADSMPQNVWPYVFHSATRGGADMLYRHLSENVGYTLSHWHYYPPKMQDKAKITTHASKAANRKRKRA